MPILAVPGKRYGREWLRGLVGDLESDGLVATERTDDGLVASLRE
jgi:hypothetical protein